MIQAGLLLILLGVGLALVALLVYGHSRCRRRQLGLPAGRVVRADTGGWCICLRPLYSARYRLAGKPDYVVRTGRNLVPVEVKPGRQAVLPYPSDVLQLGAYLLLVEEETGRRPAHGLLHYAERTFEIPYTAGLRRQVIEALDEMQRLRSARHVTPQHGEPQRCLRCGYREHCDQALA